VPCCSLALLHSTHWIDGGSVGWPDNGEVQGGCRAAMPHGNQNDNGSSVSVHHRKAGQAALGPLSWLKNEAGSGASCVRGVSRLLECQM
jgi:hypothetical protein